MVGLAGEVACVAHGAIVLPLRASKLKSKPGPCGKVSGAHVPHGAHLAGAREEDLGALVQPHGPLSSAWAASAAPAATQGSFRFGKSISSVNLFLRRSRSCTEASPKTRVRMILFIRRNF